MWRGTRFLKRVDKALQDPQMRSAVPFTQDRLRMGREQATQELGNMEEWREAASEIRMHTIGNLDSYLEQLATNVRKNGGMCISLSKQKMLYHMFLKS